METIEDIPTMLEKTSSEQFTEREILEWVEETEEHTLQDEFQDDHSENSLSDVETQNGNQFTVLKVKHEEAIAHFTAGIEMGRRQQYCTYLNPCLKRLKRRSCY
ncbi:unnamed protein product [Acanthoscelides obtectus]|uniref:Uncharacterized protein n=1 Tax=Acanthoscelides obtectus TaxID=200917 RepID=A0A9P0QGF3_ACAOB|nr:unnamed protein product [Acanthoscelides obtectus]CAH2019687.1 unnamed protein product [Acanthoscelides obtectus]CAK1673823.1 hypothetical protein AOBTE_LOCUS29449 [Acanthoscelides obtectus]CAK1689461.1 hypothetical protein AOBTE_LOCUS37271 [Acanthoscelides obtectus]